MDYNPYSQFGERELTLNDHLAIDRTILANERTLLSYSRTALTMLVIGGTCIKFFGAWWMWAIGAAFLAGSVFVSAWGWRRYTRTKGRLSTALIRRTGAAEHPLQKETAARKSAPAAADTDAPAAPPSV